MLEESGTNLKGAISVSETRKTLQNVGQRDGYLANRLDGIGSFTSRDFTSSSGQEQSDRIPSSQSTVQMLLQNNIIITEPDGKGFSSSFLNLLGAAWLLRVQWSVCVCVCLFLQKHLKL